MSAAVLQTVSAGLLSAIGNTPLLPISLASSRTARVYGKAEFLNPGGSVKDRPALRIIQTAEQQGVLSPGTILLDSTSGNTGIAYAMIGASRGFKVRLCLPENASPERKQILRAYGAELELTPAAEGSDGALRVCKRLYESDPHRFFYANQYDNDANWRSHYETTGPEILEQTNGEVTHFVAALGTSGTFTGVSRRFRASRAAELVRCIAVQPATPFHGLEGVKHMATAIRPGIYDETLVDDTFFVETEEAYEMARRLARAEGLLLGVSAAANVVAASRLANSLAERNEAGTVVTILCDSGHKYLSEEFWIA